MGIDELKKPVDTIELAGSAIGLLKNLGMIFAMVLIEWARARQRLAENKQAVAEAQTTAEQKKGEIDAKNSGKSPADIIDDFLASGSSGLQPPDK